MSNVHSGKALVSGSSSSSSQESSPNSSVRGPYSSLSSQLEPQLSHNALKQEFEEGTYPQLQPFPLQYTLHTQPETIPEIVKTFYPTANLLFDKGCGFAAICHPQVPKKITLKLSGFPQEHGCPVLIIRVWAEVRMEKTAHQ